jgi:hypothetical protein
MDSASRIPIQQYYQEKYGWSIKTFNEIAWDIQYKVMMSYNANDQHRLLKYVHRWLPPNHRLHRELQTHTQRCPVCYYIVEDEQHLLRCKDFQQSETVKNLCGQIQDLPIATSIKKHIIETIRGDPQRIIRINKQEHRREKGPRKMMENYINWHPPD